MHRNSVNKSTSLPAGQDDLIVFTKKRVALRMRKSLSIIIEKK
jgi:hypothetical protein